MKASVVNVRGLSRPLPSDTVYIGRRAWGFPESNWANPFRIGDPDPNGYPMDREQVLALYRRYALAKLSGDPSWLEPLRDRILACWCFPLGCHGDILLELMGL